MKIELTIPDDMEKTAVIVAVARYYEDVATWSSRAGNHALANKVSEWAVFFTEQLERFKRGENI